MRGWIGDVCHRHWHWGVVLFSHQGAGISSPGPRVSTNTLSGPFVKDFFF